MTNDYYKLMIIVRSDGHIAVTTPGFQTMNDAEIAAKQIEQFNVKRIFTVDVIRLYEKTPA